LAYASPQGRTFIDRELYLPKAWAEDAERCREAGVPDEVTFATKPQLAQRMLARALAAGVHAPWVAGDEVDGSALHLRHWLEDHKQPFVLAVSRNERVWISTGAYLRHVTGARVAATMPRGDWQRLRAGDGAKGPRFDAWALKPFVAPGDPGWGPWLLVRRSLSAPAELAYYIVFGADGCACTATGL
jgi:SRSO17 transposase